MNKLIDLDGIIFDVDGTLWDATDEVANSWNMTISQLPKQIDTKVDSDMLRALFGKTMSDICKAIFPTMSEAEQLEFGDRLFDTENEWLETHPGTIYEGVYETLEKLSKQVPLFVVSNCQQGYIEIMLEATKMQEFFRGQLCYGDTLTSKGKTIRTLIKQYNLKNVVYIGDTQGDADACAEADVPFIFASYGFGDVPDAKDKINDIRELLNDE